MCFTFEETRQPRKLKYTPKSGIIPGTFELDPKIIEAVQDNARQDARIAKDKVRNQEETETNAYSYWQSLCDGIIDIEKRKTWVLYEPIYISAFNKTLAL
jgi:hypothetical protein